MYIMEVRLFAVSETPGFSFWDKPFTGNSEYVDNISEIGLTNMKDQQQYLEPLISLGKEFDDCNL